MGISDLGHRDYTLSTQLFRVQTDYKWMWGHEIPVVLSRLFKSITKIVGTAAMTFQITVAVFNVVLRLTSQAWPCVRSPRSTCLEPLAFSVVPGRQFYHASSPTSSYLSHNVAQSKGVKKASATNLALAFKNSFISDISLSTSSMNWMMKSTSLCLSISSVWKFVMRKEMS